MATAPVDPTKEIDARSSLTPYRLVIALVGVCLLVGAAVLWALFGRAPETVTGRGIILPEGGYAELGTSILGVVDRVLVAPGDEVIPGQTLVTVRTQKGDSTRLGVDSVRAPQAGLVIDVLARPGRATNSGEPLLTMDPDGGAQQAKGFLPSATQELVEVGMLALVSPSNVPRAQFGYIEGTVIATAPAPANRGRLLTLLGDNAALTDYFLAQGPVGEVTVQLAVANTPSGYEWTLGDGPDKPVSAGLLADVAVVIDDPAVIDRMVP